MSVELKRRLTRAAFEIAALLNTVEDDDERDSLHGHVEKVVNDELYAGSVNRAHAQQLLANFDQLVGLFELPRPGAAVVDLHSVRVQREER